MLRKAFVYTCNARGCINVHNLRRYPTVYESRSVCVTWICIDQQTMPRAMTRHALLRSCDMRDFAKYKFMKFARITCAVVELSALLTWLGFPPSGQGSWPYTNIHSYRRHDCFERIRADAQEGGLDDCARGLSPRASMRVALKSALTYCVIGERTSAKGPRPMETGRCKRRLGCYRSC